MSSRLLSLPAELRNEIYIYVFADKMCIDERQVVAPSYRPSYHRNDLLLVNHQVHTEAIALFYHIHNFEFSSLWTALEWWYAIPARFRTQVKSFEFPTKSMRKDARNYRRYGWSHRGSWVRFEVWKHYGLDEDERDKWVHEYVKVAERKCNDWRESVVVTNPIRVKIKFKGDGKVEVEVPNTEDDVTRLMRRWGR